MSRERSLLPGTVWVHTNGHRYFILTVEGLKVLYCREDKPGTIYERSVAEFLGLNDAGVPRFTRIEDVR
jgi:hypothetical protein